MGDSGSGLLCFLQRFCSCARLEVEAAVAITISWMGRKLWRCSGQIPCVRRADLCFAVPYPTWLSKP